MAIGMRLKNVHGSTVLAVGMRNPVLKQQGTAVAESDGLIGTRYVVTYVGDASSRPVCAFRATGAAFPWTGQVGNSGNGWTWTWSYSGAGSYYVFDYATSGPASGTIGMRIGGGPNPLAFAHTHLPLRIDNVIVGETTYLPETAAPNTSEGAPANLTGADGRVFALVHGRLAFQTIYIRSGLEAGEYRLSSYGLRAITVTNGFAFQYSRYSQGPSVPTPDYSSERRLGHYSYALADVTNY